MTTDSMLVTRRAPTMSGLRAAVLAAGRRTELGTAQLVGDWDDGDPMVEISADVSDGELLAQLLRPSISLSTAAEPYTVRIGLAPPVDADGHCWLTAISTDSSATDAQIWAVLDVLATLAATNEGYLVTDGEHVSLDGVVEPQRVVAPAKPPRRAPANRAFINAYFSTPVVGDGAAGWRWFMNLLREVLGSHPDLRPNYIDQDSEWRPFLPSAPTPAWWPTAQYLLTPQPYLRWELEGAFGPADTLSQLAAAGDLDPDVAESFLPDLIELATGNSADEFAYGLVHAWHPDEPTGPTGLRRDENGVWLLLPPRALGERLPDLYWAQLFGPPWVRLFGADTIAATPAYRVEQVAADCWLVQLTEHLSDVVERHDQFVAARRAAKQHLGADAFFSRERGPYGSYRAASIPTLAERGVVPQPTL